MAGPNKTATDVAYEAVRDGRTYVHVRQIDSDDIKEFVDAVAILDANEIDIHGHVPSWADPKFFEDLG